MDFLLHKKPINNLQKKDYENKKGEFKKDEVKKGQIPFSIRSLKVKDSSDNKSNIMADAEVQEWEDVRWVIHYIKKYAGVLAKTYPNIKPYLGKIKEML
jgi:hypothetical protein